MVAFAARGLLAEHHERLRHAHLRDLFAADPELWEENFPAALSARAEGTRMANSYNKIILVGNLGRDAELRGQRLHQVFALELGADAARRFAVSLRDPVDLVVDVVLIDLELLLLSDLSEDQLELHAGGGGLLRATGRRSGGLCRRLLSLDGQLRLVRLFCFAFGTHFVAQSLAGLACWVKRREKLGDFRTDFTNRLRNLQVEPAARQIPQG